MDENKTNEYEQDEVTIASFNKIENSDTVEVQSIDLPVLKEDQDLLLPVASFKKVLKSDLNIPQMILEKIKKIASALWMMLLGIIRYCKDTCLFLVKSEESLGRIYRYPFLSHIGYAFLSCMMHALIPVIFVSQKMIHHTKVFKGIKMLPALCKLGFTSLAAGLVIVILLGFIIPIIEYITNKHHITYPSVIKSWNIQSIAINPFIILFMILNLLGSSISWVTMISILVLIYGMIISYFFYSKACRRYRLIRNDSSSFVMLTVFAYMVLIVSGIAVIYICNSSLLQLALKVFLK